VRLLALALLAAGCAPTLETFIEAKGSLGDGTPFDLHQSGVYDSSRTPRVVQVATSGPSDLRGFWLWFDPAVMMGQTYPSTGSSPNTGPVHFFVLRPLPDGGMFDNQASLVDGGSITFQQAGPDNYSGSLANLILTRSGQTLATVTSGSFAALKR
jgi:hypothetical protein